LQRVTELFDEHIGGGEDGLLDINGVLKGGFSDLDPIDGVTVWREYTSTVLHLAVIGDHLEVVQFLVGVNANANGGLCLTTRPPGRVTSNITRLISLHAYTYF
jgi:hypothetical protein